jgi:morphogenetic protein associated with SpoVID
VKKGDTMSKIANKFNLTVDEVMAANPQIKNPNKISIGDEVTIPVPKADEESS